MIGVLSQRLNTPLVAERLNAYSILETPRDATFDRYVYTAAQLFRVPIAALFLIDEGRMWAKASVGMAHTELPLDDTMCAHLGQTESVMVVEDASRDVRFAENPLVTGAPFIRFYAGAPLVTPDGLRVGSLCVMDRVAKTLLTRQTWQLTQLAASVTLTLEARRPLATDA